MIESLVEAFRRNPRILKVWNPSIPKHILEQIDDKDSFYIEYTAVDEHMHEYPTALVVPRSVVNEITDFDAAVNYAIDEINFCGCTLCNGLHTGSINNKFEYQGDPVFYFDTKKGRAMQLQGFNYAEWVKPALIDELKGRLEALPYILYVQIEPSRVADNMITIHIRYTNADGEEPKVYRPVATMYPDYLYLDPEQHDLIVADIYSKVVDRVEKS